MATNYQLPGNVITHASSAAQGVASGAAIAINNIVAVALGTFAQNVAGSYAVEGVFELPKDSSAGAMNQGTQAFLVAGEISDAIGAGIFAGTVWETAGASDETVKVRINFGNYGEDNVSG